MLEVEVALPSPARILEVENLIEKVCTAEGLRQTLKGRLARYPGSVHWHFKKGEQRGTFEITLWRAQRRLWLTVQAGRVGDWIEEALPRLRRAIARDLTAGKK